ncbi:MAG TPA: efflux RND transporter periplasmic adaptor subunit [Gemmatimonadales bacterium]|nr:efflux RND transporter periplasmic adaptor subunit [Gemmatimonadales bacterium]
MKRWLKWGIPVLIVLSTAAALPRVLAHSPSAGDQPASARVIRRDFSATVLATGAVRPEVGAEVKVGARIPGKVVRLHANVGDPVVRGQVIAELEKDDLLAAVDRARAEVAVADARVVDAEARARLAELDFERQSELLEAQVTSQQEKDQAAKEREVAQAAVLLAQKQLESQRAAVREAEVRLSYATIQAPIAGVIGSISTQEGETVATGFSAPTFVTIIDLDRLQVDAFVDEVDIGKVEPGQSGTFTVDAFPGRDFEGRVTAIYPKAVIQDNVVNYDVVLSITTPYHGLLRPEMTASVALLLGARTGVLAIPAQAVKRVDGRTVVYLSRDGGGFDVREIRVGWKDGEWLEVTDGLAEGDRILLDPPATDTSRRPQ